MKIAIYSDNFYPEVSGITDSLVLLGKVLAGLGHSVYFFAPKYSPKDFAKSKLDCEEIDLGPNVKIIRFGSLPYSSSPTGQSRIVIPTPWRYLKLKNLAVDIIHTNSFFGMGLEALRAAKKLKIPLVGTNHTPIDQFIEYSPVKFPGLSELCVKFLIRYYNKCLFVTAPSNHMLDEMKTQGLRIPSQAVSNPLDTIGFVPVDVAKKDILKKEFGFSGGNTVIYTGRLAPEKKIDVIIKAINLVKKEIPDIKLALTGHGSAVEDLKKMVSELGLVDNVIFFGYVEVSKLIKLYQAADIFSIMSTAETQCLSMMQAMATGLPVVAANAGALPEFVGTDRGYIVEPGNHEELAKKIKELLRNPELRDRLGRNGLEFSKTISAENIGQKWIAIYQELINKAKQ